MYLRSDWFIQELRYLKFQVHITMVKYTFKWGGVLTAFFHSPFIISSSSSSSGSEVEDPKRGNMPKNKDIQRKISISSDK